MKKAQLKRRIAAVKAADAIIKISGGPTSPYAQELSCRWAKGELTGEQMKQLLLEYHQKTAIQAQ